MSNTNLNASRLLGTFLPALPGAAVSKEPAVGSLPLLSPILRQRVQVFGASSADPWLRWLCYDAAKAAQLSDVVNNGALEPHPVSGEVEVDWDYDAETRYRRIDEETLQALVALTEIGIAFQLVYCVGDKEGGGDGWRIGEVTVVDKPSPFLLFGGVSSVAEAERQFKEQPTINAPEVEANGTDGHGNEAGEAAQRNNTDDDNDDDEGYWDRYDKTPSRTPAQGLSPMPRLSSDANGRSAFPAGNEEEEDYYAQYDSVQPAMDNHDPDEAAAMQEASPSLATHGQPFHPQDTPELMAPTQRPEASMLLSPRETDAQDETEHRNGLGLLHPRPESSASSRSSTVARLEATVDQREQNEFGVKQHVSRSIRSLYLLSKSSGINREEFEQIVRTELDILGMIEDQEL